MIKNKVNITNKLDTNTLKKYKTAIQIFKSFEIAYQSLRPSGLEYLHDQSLEYKSNLRMVQKSISSAVLKHCANCEFDLCCRLNNSKLNINISSTIGCFGLIEYLLVRCGTILPKPDFSKGLKNLCPFLGPSNCLLDFDCRSLGCLKFFCEPIRKEIDIQTVEIFLRNAQNIVNQFSVNKLFELK